MKKRKLKYSIVSLLILAFLSGCTPKSKETMEETEGIPVISADESGESFQQALSLYFAVDMDKLPEERVFYPKDGIVSIDIDLEAGDSDIDLGLMVFADGILQPITVNDNHTVLMEPFIQEANTGSEKIIALSPPFDLLGDSVQLNIIFVEDTRLQDIQRDTLFFVRGLEMETYYIENKNGALNKGIIENLNEDYRIVPLASELPEELSYGYGIFEVYGEDESCWITAENNIAKLNFSAIAAEDDHLYRAMFFINHVPVEINGESYFDFYGNEDKQYIYTFELDTAELEEANLAYFMVTDITGGEENQSRGIQKSGNAIIYK